MAKPENFNIHTLIEYLQGTCNSLQAGVEQCYEGMDESDLSKEDLEAIDNEIFCCETCNWWYEICEASEEDGVCNDCHGDSD